MSLTAETIFQTILPNYECKLLGPRKAEIFSCWYYRRSVPCKQGLIYIAPSNVELSQAPGASIIVVQDSAKIREVFVMIRQIIMRDYKSSLLFEQLGTAVKSNSSEDEIIQLCYSIMENSVLYLGLQFQPISWGSTNQENILPSLFDYQDLLQHSLHLHGNAKLIPPGPLTHYCRILGQILSGGKPSGYLLALNDEHPFDEHLDVWRLDRLCQLLSEKPELSPSGMKWAEAENFIAMMIQNKFSNPGDISRKAKALGWTLSDKYYILTINNRYHGDSEKMRLNLSGILNREIYTYANYYIAVIPCLWNQKIQTSSYPKLTAFLKKHGLKAGISNGFSDIAFFSAAFRQSTESVILGDTVFDSKKSPVLFHFEDYIMTYLLNLASAQTNLLELVNPIVMRIYDYDKEHSTDYLTTLAAYISTSQNMQKTSSLLTIHRNTIYNRIIKIEEMFELHFGDDNELWTLRISILILNHLGLIDVSDILTH